MKYYVRITGGRVYVLAERFGMLSYSPGLIWQRLRFFTDEPNKYLSAQVLDDYMMERPVNYHLGDGDGTIYPSRLESIMGNGATILFPDNHVVANMPRSTDRSTRYHVIFSGLFRG
jgi:hypothetical protein